MRKSTSAKVPMSRMYDTSTARMRGRKRSKNLTAP